MGQRCDAIYVRRGLLTKSQTPGGIGDNPLPREGYRKMEGFILALFYKLQKKQKKSR